MVEEWKKERVRYSKDKIIGNGGKNWMEFRKRMVYTE